MNGYATADLPVEAPQVRQLLDHGHIRGIDFMGSDLRIVQAARQSYAAEWRAGKDKGSDDRLLRFLIREGHTSPFEHVVVSFEMKLPLFVVAQWHRHRTQSYSQISARYTELPEEFYVPEAHLIGVQSTTNHQSRVIDPEWTPSPKLEQEIEMFRQGCARQFDLYHTLLDRGWPRELARTCLPTGTYTQMWATANLWNWIKFLSERLSMDAQYEIRVYAQAIVQSLHAIAPVTIDAFAEQWDMPPLGPN